MMFRQASTQTGAALMLMMLVVMIAATATLLARLSNSSQHVRSLTDTRVALQRAKQSLLTYASVQADLTGSAGLQLPCPDLGAGGGWVEGESHSGSCGVEGETMLGRLPWRTLETDVYRDGGDECLWYIVSGTYKGASTATMPMLNPDNNGQIQLFSFEEGTILEGELPQDRPVAMIIAPMQPLTGQTRQGVVPSAQCGADFTLAAYFETDIGSGISNATVSGTPYTVDQLVTASGRNDTLNDRFQVIRRSELASLVHGRHDFADTMNALGQTIAECIAQYGRNNPGGVDDRRLPWPAPLALGNYVDDSYYDDVDSGVLSGRLVDHVDDSSNETGSSVSQVLTNCDPAVVPTWQPGSLALWQHWKDHFFYVVAESFQPNAVVPSSCGQCLTMNGAGQYAAIVFFANERLESLQQIRNAPPLDLDTRGDVNNYLESRNATNHPYSGGNADYTSAPSGSSFNDLAFCIDDFLNVSSC